jgi:ribosomal protein S18 acetylase RimI-like enzyme
MEFFNVRQATRDDEPFLWLMMYYAAHMDEQGLDTSAVRNVPALAKYVVGWGRHGDLGFVAVESVRNEPIGAAWLREFAAADPGQGFIDASIPVLAIAVLPSYTGRGIGTVVLQGLLAAAGRKYPAVSLKVRQSNPAVRLYERLGFRKVPGSEMVNRVGGVSCIMELVFGA